MTPERDLEELWAAAALWHLCACCRGGRADRKQLWGLELRQWCCPGNKLAGSGVGPSRSLREMDHSNTASMDALHDEMSMPLKSIMLVLEYEGSIGRNSGSIALRYTDAARIGAVPVQGLKFRVFAAPLPRAVARRVNLGLQGRCTNKPHTCDV